MCMPVFLGLLFGHLYYGSVSPKPRSSESIALEIPGLSLNSATSWKCSKARLNGEKATIMSNFYISKMESDNVTFKCPITIAFTTASICSNKEN